LEFGRLARRAHTALDGGKEGSLLFTLACKIETAAADRGRVVDEARLGAFWDCSRGHGGTAVGRERLCLYFSDEESSEEMSWRDLHGSVESRYGKGSRQARAGKLPVRLGSASQVERWTKKRENYGRVNGGSRRYQDELAFGRVGF